MSAVERLRPHPHRGAVTAAGAVPLAIAGFLIELRMTQWSRGALFLVITMIAGLILTMGWLAPLEGDAPRAYHSVLLVAGLLPMVVALMLLAELLGANRPPGAGGLAWTFALEAVIAAAAARRANSGACTLIAALAGAVAVEAFVSWAFEPHGAATFRAVLLAASLALIAGVTRLRDRRRRHAVQLANAIGVLALVLAANLASGELAALVVRSPFGPHSIFGSGIGASFGWKFYLLAVGLGLVAYAAADREPGPAYIGVAVLLAFVLLAGATVLNRGSLVGWPLFLLVIGGAGLAIGMRPRRPLPPEPSVGGAPSTSSTIPLAPEPGAPPTVPLRPVDDEQ